MRIAIAALTLLAIAVSAAPARAGELRIVPRAACQPGDKPDTGLQGQVPLNDRQFGRAQEGYSCNLSVVGTHEGRVFGGFDQYQHCLYVADETWIGAALALIGDVAAGDAVNGIGVRVLDISDPEHPRQTAVLTSPMALTPDESLTVNVPRGLLAMNSTGDSRLDVYDIKTDCEHPKLVGTFDMGAAKGHAGWFSPDGMTYWMTYAFGRGAPSIFPVSLADPDKPELLGTYSANQLDTGSGHNGWVSDDGKTTYACQIGNTVEANRVLVLRSPTEPSDADLVTSFPLDGAVCQNMQSVSYDGRPFLIANSEYTVGRFLQKGPTNCDATQSNPTSFSTPQIFDIGDIMNPKVVSALALEVDDPANCEATANDGGDLTSGTAIPGEIYDTHFCRPDRLHDPTILACARFVSGLEVYDIRDPYNPKELAYFRPGTLGTQATLHPEWATTPATVDDVAAPPIVNAARGEIAFGSYFTGVRIVKFPKSVYPFKDSLSCERDYYFNQYNPGHCPATKPTPRDCLSHRSVRVPITGLPAGDVRSTTVIVDGRKRTVRGNRRTVRVPLGSRGRVVPVKLRTRMADGAAIVNRRSYKRC